MSNLLLHSGLDWHSAGYYYDKKSVIPSPIFSGNLNLWNELETLLKELKLGKFSNIYKIIRIFDSASDDSRLRRVCATILGDAGTDSCLKSVRANINPLHVEKAVKYFHTLSNWGSVSAIHTMIDIFYSNYMFQAAESMSIHFSMLLVKDFSLVLVKPKDNQIDDYCNSIESRISAIKDDTLIWNGDIFSIVQVAERLMDCLSDSHYNRVFQTFARHKIEASTGIDCTGFYENEIFQPLAAASIIESFLDSDVANEYEDGVRYFFGHRIPD